MLVWLMSKEECKISLYKCPAYAFSILVKRFSPELPEKHFFFCFLKKGGNSKFNSSGNPIVNFSIRELDVSEI